jgi:hypothetical protein
MLLYPRRVKINLIEIAQKNRVGRSKKGEKIASAKRRKGGALFSL